MRWGGLRGLTPLIINVGTRWKSVVNFTPQPFSHREQIPVPIEYEAGMVPRKILEDFEEKMFYFATIRIPGRSVYGLVAISTTLPSFSFS